MDYNRRYIARMEAALPLALEPNPPCLPRLTERITSSTVLFACFHLIEHVLQVFRCVGLPPDQPVHRDRDESGNVPFVEAIKRMNPMAMVAIGHRLNCSQRSR